MKCYYCENTVGPGEEIKNPNDNTMTVHKCTCGCVRIEGNEVNYSPDYFSGNFPDFNEYKKSQLNNLGKIREVIAEGKFLDVGCSDGAMMQLMLEKGYDVYGFDVINVMKTDLIFRDKIKVWKRLNTWKTKKMFDIIQMREVIEHVDEPVKDLSWCYNHLNDKGWLFIQTPDANGNSPGKFAEGHLHLITPERLTQELIKVGFLETQLISNIDGCIFMRARK